MIRGRANLLRHPLSMYEEALDSFEKACKIFEQAHNIPEKDYFFIHLNRAVTLVKLGKEQKALEVLEELLTSENKVTTQL